MHFGCVHYKNNDVASTLFVLAIQAVIKTDAGRDLCTVEGENGNTPLHFSCEKGDLEIVKVSYLATYLLYVCIYIYIYIYMNNTYYICIILLLHTYVRMYIRYVHIDYT